MLAIVFGIIVTIIVIILFKDYYKDLKKFFSLIIIFAITTIFIYMIISNIHFLKDIISKNNFILYDKLVILLTSMSIAILIDGIFANIIQKLYENYIIIKYEKKHKTKNYEYYRNIIQTKSPAILSYCYNKKINVEDEVIAIILSLQKRGIIELKENKLTLIGEIKKLKNHEKYVLQNIKKISSNNKEFKKVFKQLLINDLEEEEFIYVPNTEDVNIVSIMEMFMIWMILYILVAIPIFMQFSSIGALVFLAYFLTFVGIPIYKAIQENINPVIRNEKALELSGKLKGLKNYIEDYSIIKNNGIENIVLYDEYVIYAIIFNIKGKLNNECKQIYKNIKNNYI